jgi:hypothetical protein
VIAVIATISWDQTLLSCAVAAVAAWLAYRAAARVLRRQQELGDLVLRRDALDQCLALIEGTLADYLRTPNPGEDLEYPQREMVELERRVVQAQILFWRDLEMQQRLRDLTYPGRQAEATAQLRATLAKLEGEARALGART